MPCSGFDKSVDVRKCKAIFWTCFVEVGEIHTNTPFAILFLHNHRIGKPHGIFDFGDQASFKESNDLSIDCFCTIRTELSALLFDRFKRWIDIELMRDNFHTDSSHFSNCPSECCFIHFEEMN